MTVPQCEDVVTSPPQSVQCEPVGLPTERPLTVSGGLYFIPVTRKLAWFKTLRSGAIVFYVKQVEHVPAPKESEAVLEGSQTLQAGIYMIPLERELHWYKTLESGAVMIRIT